MESNNWLINFVNQKVNISKALFKGNCNASYPEAIIILSSIISGIASEIWPGYNFDRKRFVELLIKFVKPYLNTNMISIPLLINDFDNSKNDVYLKSSKILKNQYNNFPMTQVLIGDEIDKYELDILKICPNIPLKKIREFSYANIFYQQVRCGFIHEYMLEKLASSHSQTSRQTFISYVNVLTKPNRRIHFHFEWLLEVIKSVKENIIPILDDIPFNLPKFWWLDEK